jgi:hypothetical protein
MTDTVILSQQLKGGYKSVYHSDPECHVLDQIEQRREVPDDHPLLEDRRECKYCTGYTPPTGPKGTYLSTRLDDLDPEDIGLTPNGERA